MKVYTHLELVWDGEQYVLDEAASTVIDYDGPVALCGGKGGGDAPSPDPQIGQAALRNAAIGEEWLDFAKDQFAVGNARQEITDDLNSQVIEQQLQSQGEANQWAREDRDRTKTVFQPLENEFVKTAQEFDTPEKQAEAAAQAKADVLSQAAVQKASGARQMAAMGVSPDSGRFAGTMRAADTNTALAAAGAQNNARQIIRDKGLALKADAINMGKGLASSTAAAYGIGTNAGNSAVANNASGNQNFYQNQGVMGQGFQGAIGANNSAGSMLNNLYGNQLNAWSAEQQANQASAAGLGNLIGTGVRGAAMFMSDRRAKQDIRLVGYLGNGLPFYTFRYKPEFRDKWGVGFHVGVMAQDAEIVIPEAVHLMPSGFKAVDYARVM